MFLSYQAYYQKLMSKKPRPDIDAKVLQCEKALDVFNITLARKQVEMRVERQGKEKDDAPKGGWFSGWFGGGASTTAQTTTTGIDIAKKLEEALTPEEKQKLYQAIDYTEGALPLDFPEEYLEYKLNFNLQKLKCVIRDVIDVSSQGQKILDLEISNVENL
jgi:vacuolar protein sorting-associated protein 13A/C